MKNKLPIFLFLTTFLFTVAAFGQSAELSDVGRVGFKGVRKMDQNGYYIQFEEGATGASRNVRVIVLNNDLQAQADFKLPLKTGEKLEDISYTDGKFLLVTSLYSKRTKTFLVVDKTGAQIATKQFTELNARVFDQPATIIPLENDFVVVSMFREKKVGYVIERYSSMLDAKYAETYVPEKKKLYPIDFTVANGVLYVLESYERDFADSFEFHIAGFNTSDGKQIFNNYLKSADEKSYGYPTFIRITPKGEAITGGMYFNNDKEQEANSDGFFSAMVGKDGMLRYEYKAWKEVADKLKDKGTNLIWGGKTKTLMHDVVVNNDGSFTLVGENFRQGDESLAGGKKMFSMTMTTTTNGNNSTPAEEWAVTVSDFALFDFDAQNKFVNVRKISKPFAVTIIHATSDPNDKPYSGQFRGLNMANMLNNYGYFPYRFTATKGDEKVLVYQLNYERMYKELLYFTRLNGTSTDTVSVEITNSMLKTDQALNSDINQKKGKLAKFQDKVNKNNGESIQNEVTLGASDNPNNFQKGSSLNVRVLPSNVDGKVLLYDFVPELTGDDAQKKSMFAKYRASRDAAVKAKLKVWYLDIPAKR